MLPLSHIARTPMLAKSIVVMKTTVSGLEVSLLRKKRSSQVNRRPRVVSTVNISQSAICVTPEDWAERTRKTPKCLD
jgi:hypothetical protein